MNTSNAWRSASSSRARLLEWFVWPCLIFIGTFALNAIAASADAPVKVPAFFEMVKMPAGYFVAKYEVTQEQYETITDENPSAFPDPRKPVENVSWEDAVAFCEKLTAREHAAHRLPDGYAYDLPTDAQWDEFAAGTDPRDAALSLDTRRDSTEPVGSHPPNALGLFDVAGNVWEWCRDWYDNSIRKKDSNRDMPYIPSDAEVAAAPPEEIFKVLRGGSWDTGRADDFSLAARLRYAPGMRNYRTGFRCVLVPVAAPKPAVPLLSK